MRAARRLGAVLALSVAVLILDGGAALAQVTIDPAPTPERNTGGWVYGMAWLITILAFLSVILIVVGYMRYAPRFAKDEETSRVVHADRVLPGREPPRRAVDLSQAVPIVVQPPALPKAVAAVGAPAVAAPAATPADAASAAAAPAAPPAAGAPAAPAAAPAEAAPAEAAPAGSTPPAAAPAPSAPAAPAERVEVTMDQEVFDATLAELIAQGTDRRIAEGKARRAGMIAARKKAEGGE
jgi:uncharacterized membrane protein